MSRRRRKNKTNQTLKALVGILSFVFIAVLVIALTLDSSGDEPTLSQPTDDSTPTETRPTTATTQPTETTQPPLTGWQQDGENLYYYGDDGVIRTGVTEIDGSVYCLGEDGALCGTGFQEIFGETYYVNEDGSPYIGWLELEDDLYYLQTDGTMARGEVEIDGETWFFTSTGCQIYVVNPWHSVPEGYTVKLVKLSSDYGTNRYVADFMYDDLMQMIYDCEAAMVEMFAGTSKTPPTLWVRSANRSNYDQECLFENKVARVKAANPGLTQAEAEAEAATVVARPGTSEHQLGLAVDIVDTQLNSLVEAQENLEGQQWLMENCWKYGFILRYPKGTTDVTGIIYEPWHYRYVGHELAAELHELGITLEEYIANLTE